MCRRMLPPGTSTALRGKRSSSVWTTIDMRPQVAPLSCAASASGEFLAPCACDAFEGLFVGTLGIVFEVVEFGDEAKQLRQRDLRRIVIRMSLCQLEADVLDILPREAHALQPSPASRADPHVGRPHTSDL